MKVFVNGEDLELPDQMSVADLLQARGLSGKRLAVERNGEIVPKGRHSHIIVEPLDEIEIVVAVGGG